MNNSLALRQGPLMDYPLTLSNTHPTGQALEQYHYDPAVID